MADSSSDFSVRRVLATALALLHFEKREVLIVVVYTMVLGVLGFASTVSVQFLINSISFTGQKYPVLLLSSITIVLLFFVTVLQIMRRIVIELIQQRVMVRVCFGAVDSLGFSGLDRKDWYRREIVHRYFDAFVYQKAMTTLLIDGIGIVIVTVLGVILVTLYHPLMAFLTLFIVTVFAIIVAAFFRRAVETNYSQSSQKYRIASWLSAIAEGRSLIWNSSTHEFVLEQTDIETSEYLRRRQAHFSILIWQQGSLFALQAVAAGLLLGAGGIFVLSGQINLGQLVAAEAILIAVLYGLVEFGKSLESAYDAITAAQKLMPLLKASPVDQGEKLLDQLDFDKNPVITLKSPVVKQGYTLKPGDVVALKGSDSETRRTLLWHLIGLEFSPDWDVDIGDAPLSMISQRWQRQNVLFIDRPTVFDVDLRSNLSLLKSADQNFSSSGVLDNLPLLPGAIYGEGDLETASYWGKDPRIRLHVALLRVFFTNARVVVIDDIFSRLSRQEKMDFLTHVRKHEKHKIFVVNCDSDLDLAPWTQVIEWT